MWNGLQNSLCQFLAPRLLMKKLRLRTRLLVLIQPTLKAVRSQSCDMSAGRCGSGTMERTRPVRQEPLNMTETNKRTAWRQCGKLSGFVQVGLTVLSAFATIPSFAASVNISCVQDYITGECTDVGDSANRAVNVNVVAGGGGGGTSSTFGAAFPATGTAAGYSDGTNMQGGRVFDTDSGGGTEWTLGTILRKAGVGGSVDFGTLADPIRIDPTGTTIQPVSGPLTDAQLRATPVPVSGPLTDAQLRATPVPVSGTVAATQSGTWTVQPGNTPNTAPWLTESIKVSSANNTGSCPSGAGNTTALASNASRRGAYMAAASNNTDDIFVKLGATATTANFRLAPGQSFNILTGSIYTGIIDFIPNSGTQALCVAELN
jgi:hypothetical protein